MYEITVHDTTYDEIANNGRNFIIQRACSDLKVGDDVIFREIEWGYVGDYTGRSITASVTFIQQSSTYLQNGYSVIGFDVKEVQP